MPAHRQRLVALTLRAALPAALFAAGCAGPLEEIGAQIPKTAARGAVKGGATALAAPTLRRQIAEILASPGMHAIQRELVAGVLDSTLDALGEEERLRRIEAVASRATAHVARGARRELPAVAEQVTRAAVAGALGAMTDGLRDARAGAGISTAMTEQIGPAMESTLRDDIGPGLAAVLGNEEVQRSLGATARILSREIVAGTAEAIAAQEPPPEAGSLLARITDFARSAAWVLLLVIALLFAWIIKLLAQARRYRSDASRKVATAQLLAEAARASEGKPWAGELIGALEQRVRAEERALAELRGPRRRVSRARTARP